MMKRIHVFGMFLVLLAGGAYAIDLDESIISFPAESTSKQYMADKLVIDLVEVPYAPIYQIKYRSKSSAVKNIDVEKALISRFSAIAAKDLAWWKREWSSEKEAEKSLEMVLSFGTTVNAMLERWGNITDNYDIFLTRKISYKEYKIVMYRPVSKGTNKTNALNLPIVLKETENGWKVTSDLAKSTLMSYTPWASGKYDVKETNSLWVLE